jgi:hypothetical protein
MLAKLGIHTAWLYLEPLGPRFRGDDGFRGNYPCAFGAPTAHENGEAPHFQVNGLVVHPISGQMLSPGSKVQDACPMLMAGGMVQTHSQIMEKSNAVSSGLVPDDVPRRAQGPTLHCGSCREPCHGWLSGCFGQRPLAQQVGHLITA